MKFNPKKLAKRAAKVAVVTNPAANLLYTGGAAANRLTGGNGPLLLRDGLKGKKPVTFSQTTQALSGYQGRDPGRGTQRLPLANRSTTTGVGKVAATVVKDVAAPVLTQTTKTVFGVDPKVIAWGALGTAAGLGTLAVVRKTA